MSTDAAPPDPPPLPGGAVVADAIAAPAAGSSGHDHPVHSHCENCGAALHGPFCHRCGQHDIEFHRSFGHVFLEALENFFHFDAKLFRNIVTLLFQPGQLTAEFNAGKRAAQMPPFRLYLFVSVLFFFVSFLGGDQGGKHDLNLGGPKPGSVTSPDDKVQPEEVRQALAEAAQEIARKTSAPKDATEDQAGKGRESNGAASRDTSAFARELTERGNHIVNHPKEFIGPLLHALPKMLLVCLPFFALYTRVLFRKSGQVYLQHLIVALHFHTFVFLWWLVARGWFGLVGLRSPDFAGLLGFLTGLWMFFYPFLMLRRLFAQSWTKIVLKTLLLAGTYAVTLGLALGATAAIIFFNV